MRIRVRYFAVVRERLGLTEELLELPDDASAGMALDTLLRKHPALAELSGLLQLAVNQRVVTADTPLHHEDELALIPPVAGGEGGESRPQPRLARIVADRPPSLDAVMAAVMGPAMGGVAAFVGVVRETSAAGQPVTQLDYEAYGEMADKVLCEICDEIERELPGTRLAVEHRAGSLTVGQVAVAIAAAAPHRVEAFDACQALIDRLKERAPIWKKEYGPAGPSWIGG